MSRPAGAKTQDPIPKIIKTKRTGDMVQIVEHKALS
jgi:hypothetical protein